LLPVVKKHTIFHLWSHGLLLRKHFQFFKSKMCICVVMWIFFVDWSVVMSLVGEGYGAAICKIPEQHGQSYSPQLEQLFEHAGHTGKIRRCASVPVDLWLRGNCLFYKIFCQCFWISELYVQLCWMKCELSA
jgi:hypothetical protein